MYFAMGLSIAHAFSDFCPPKEPVSTYYYSLSFITEIQRLKIADPRLYSRLRAGVRHLL